MFGKAYIHTSGNAASWKIPYEALLDGHGSTGYVFASNDGKTVKKVEVTTSALEQDGIRVESGLDNYKYVVTAGSAYLTDGSAISSESK
jgi:hypothetical protein